MSILRRFWAAIVRKGRCHACDNPLPEGCTQYCSDKCAQEMAW